MTQYSGVFSLQQQGQALTSGQWCTDPYYKNTTLLLHADGVANGAQNNTFLDSSTNAFSITRNGNTTQGSFTPYGPTWSNYFGSANFFYSGSNAAFALGTGDFCVEAWVFPTAAYTTYNYILGVAATGGLVFYVTGGNLVVRGYNDGDILASSTIPALNTWTHIAATRSGTTLRIFVNGVQTASTTSAYNFAQGAIYAGNDSTNAAPWYGYISNLRLVKGSPVYTSAFAPSTTPLTAITNTSWLVCQSNRFIDAGTANSGSPFTLTVSGTPTVQRFSPFAPQYQYTPAVIGGSGYFDGTGDYLTVADDTQLDMEASNFTMEAWVYVSASIGSNATIFSKRASNAVYGGVLVICLSSNAPTLRATSNNSSWDLADATSSISLVIGQWNHVAVARSGSSWALWVNGARGATATSAGTVSNNTAAFGIGASANGTEPLTPGYMAGVRVVKGTAVYDPANSTITIPTSPPTAVANTSLLCNFTNAGIYDNAMMNDLETVGNAQVSTSVVKYGSGSMYFDGTGDYLAFQSNPAYAFGTGDFTIECWVNEAVFGSGADQGILQISTTAGGFQTTNSNTIALASWNSSGKGFRIYANATSGESGLIANTGTWYHLAVVRSSSTTKLYVNGTAVATVSSDTTNYTGTYLVVGGYYSTSYLLNGYIDDLRITKGVARYTANFQPPKVAFANQ